MNNQDKANGTTQKAKRIPTFPEAISIIIVMFAVMAYGMINGINTAILLVIIGIYVIVIGMRCGYTYTELFDSMCKGVGSISSMYLILLGIGFLIATWMFSGTVGTLIYYLLHLITAEWVIVSTFLICMVVGVSIGTSFGTVGTVGVVMVGVGVVLDVNIALLTGAIISGVNVGQALSPLCDVVNLSATLANETPLNQVKRNLYIMGPVVLVCIVFYTLMGFTSTASGTLDLTNVLDGIKSIYTVSPIALIPFVFLLIGSLKQLNTVACLFISGFVALIIGAFLNGFDLSYGLQCAFSGFTLEGIGMNKSEMLPTIVTLVERGGMLSVVEPILVCVFAMAFSGVISLINALPVVVNKVFANVKSRFGLTVGTVITAWFCAGATASTYFSLATAKEMFKEKYEKAGMSLLDLTSITGHVGGIALSIIPWSDVGAFYSGALGISVLVFAPYAILCYLVSASAIVTSVIGFGFNKKRKDINTSRLSGVQEDITT